MRALNISFVGRSFQHFWELLQVQSVDTNRGMRCIVQRNVCFAILILCCSQSDPPGYNQTTAVIKYTTNLGAVQVLHTDPMNTALPRNLRIREEQCLG